MNQTPKISVGYRGISLFLPDTSYLANLALPIVILVWSPFVLLWVYNMPGPLDLRGWCLRVTRGNRAGALAVYFGSVYTLGAIGTTFVIFWFT